MWTASARYRSANTRATQARKRRTDAGLAASREEHAIQLAQAHIAAGAREPHGKLTDRERYGDLRYKSATTKYRHGVSYALYEQAFIECLRAQAENRAPIWRNLDLVDNPDPYSINAVTHKRLKANRTSDGPEYPDEGLSQRVEERQRLQGTLHGGWLATPEQRKASTAAAKAALHKYDPKLVALARAIDKSKPRSLI
jgi:hypothetical protein